MGRGRLAAAKPMTPRNLTFKSNYVHDNGGPGLWADNNNIYTISTATRSNNWGPGIYDEISYDATIINNTITTRDAVVAGRGSLGLAGHGMPVFSFVIRGRPAASSRRDHLS